MTYCPPGTYLLNGVVTADPGGYYSTGNGLLIEDPAGTYTSQFALDRLFISQEQTIPANSALSFHTETAVANYFGPISLEAKLANEFFDNGVYDNIATMLFQREGAGQRPHLLGGNISGLTLAELQAVNGLVSLQFDGFTYSANIDFAGIDSFADAAKALK